MGGTFFLAGIDSVRLNYAFRTILMTSHTQFLSEEGLPPEPKSQKKPFFFGIPRNSGGIPAEMPTKVAIV